MLLINHDQCFKIQKLDSTLHGQTHQTCQIVNPFENLLSLELTLGKLVKHSKPLEKLLILSFFFSSFPFFWGLECHSIFASIDKILCF